MAALASSDGARSVLRSTVLVSAVSISLPLSLLEAKSYFRHTIKTSLAPEVASLVDDVTARVHPPGRLMIEDCDAIHYGDVHLPALLPLVTGVEQIGGPYPHTFLLYYFTSFRWEATFGRPLSEWNREALSKYLELYNVRWVLTATVPSRRVMERIFGRPPDWPRGPYAMWEIEKAEPPDPVKPEVDSELNRLVVSGDGDAIGYFIEYHWVPGLETSGAARIEPARRSDDPVPFIYVRPNGEDVITIEYQ
jgi:hypothetical protein